MFVWPEQISMIVHYVKECGDCIEPSFHGQSCTTITNAPPDSAIMTKCLSKTDHEAVCFCFLCALLGGGTFSAPIPSAIRSSGGSPVPVTSLPSVIQ